jgi:uncharacterized protein with GYD domain
LRLGCGFDLRPRRPTRRSHGFPEDCSRAALGFVTRRTHRGAATRRRRLRHPATAHKEEPMPRYVVLYRFTAEGAKNIRETVKRARQTRVETEKRGFKVQTLLWTQGPYDLVSIIDAPSEEAMMGAMANVVGAGNVSSTTMRAFDDKEMEGILKQT